MNKSFVVDLLAGIGYFLLYIFLFRNFVLFDTAFCMIYLAFLLRLPVENNRIPNLTIGFVTGLAVDIFSNTLGIHAAACVLLVFIRHYIIEWLTPQGGYDANISPTSANLGISWFMVYALPLIFIHHFFLFFSEAGGFSLFGITIVKVLLSTIFTFLMIVIIQNIFGKNTKKSSL